MTHARFHALLDDFLDENLSASARAEMAAHLENCAACAALKSEREADLKLSRAALSEMTRRPTPPELRLRVRAAIQDEQAAARSAPSLNWFPARAMRASAWSGTLVFGALALLIWARPFAQIPLNSPPKAASETASDATPSQTSASSDSEAKPVAPSPRPVKNGQRKATPAPLPQPTQNGFAPPQKPAPAARVNGSMRADAAPPLAPDASRSNSGFDSTSTATSITKLPAMTSTPAPMIRLPRPQESTQDLEAPRALPEVAAKPAESTHRAEAPQMAADSNQNRRAKMEAPAAAPRPSSRARAGSSPPSLGAPSPASALSGLPQPDPNFNAPREINGAMNQNRVAAAVAEFEIVVSEAAPENRQAILGSIPATGGLFRALPNQSAGSFGGAGGRGGIGGSAGGRGGFGGGGIGGGFGSVGGGFGGNSNAIPVVPQAALPTVPNAPSAPNAAAPQFSAPQQATVPAIQRAPGAAFGAVPDGVRNGATGNQLSAIENRGSAAVLQSWTITILSPRAVEGAVVRVELPPSLRVAEAAADAVFRGNLVPNRAVILRFMTRGARGGEKISVIVEQNAAAARSKPVATRILALPTPKNVR